MQTTVFTLRTPICKFEPVNLLERGGKIGSRFINTLAMCILSNIANVSLEDKQCHPQLKCCLLMTWVINYDVIRKLENQNECLKCKLELGSFFYLFSISVNLFLTKCHLPLSKQDAQEHTKTVLVMPSSRGVLAG